MSLVDQITENCEDTQRITVTWFVCRLVHAKKIVVDDNYISSAPVVSPTT